MTVIQSRMSWGDPAVGTPRYRRATILGELETYVGNVLAKKKELQSAMLAVAQYWADEADDAVHAIIVFSEKETPFWPHHCSWDERGAGDPPTLSVSEQCSQCGKHGWPPFDENGAAIIAFQSCCLEGGSQESDTEEAYLPYAVFRRGEGHAVELELVGGPVRAWLEDVTTIADPEGLEENEDEDETADGAVPPVAPVAPVPRTSRVLDSATLALLDLVCAQPHDDGPRAVLADHLQQQNDPLGEYISLALAKVAGARMRELEAAHVTTWLGPLFDVTTPEHIELARGFVRGLAVHFADDATAERVATAREWGTVEDLWFLPQSIQRLTPAMSSLRGLGPLDASGLVSLSKLAVKPPIERLHVMASEAGVLEWLAAIALPKLRQLGISGTESAEREARNPFTGETMNVVDRTPGSAQITPTMLKPLMSASWWKDLDEVVLATIEPTVVATWLARPVEDRPKTLSFSAPSPSGRPAGFRLRATGSSVIVDVPAIGSPTTFAQLVALVQAVPNTPKTITTVSLASTRWFEPSAADLKTLSMATKRTIEAVPQVR